MTTAAVVGCGDVSVVHVEAARALGIELVGMVDVAPDGRERAAAMAPGVPVFSSHAELLTRVRPDVVHVTTPHHQHAPVTLDLLAAGVNVLQEKPLANSLTGAWSLVAAAAGARSKVGICLQNRYNLASRALKEILEDGSLGELHGAYASVVWTRTPDYYQARPWRATWAQAGGGLLINQALHTLDLLQWFLGAPSHVRGQASTLKYRDVIEVEDSCTALFTHPAHGDQPEVTSTFVGSLTNAVHRNVEVEVYGSRGVATIANGLHVRYTDGRHVDVAERNLASSGRSYWGLSHQSLIEDFHQGLGDSEPFWISPAQAMVSLEMLKAVYADSWPGDPRTQ